MSPVDDLKIEIAHDGHSPIAGVERLNGEFWGAMVAPYTDPKTNLDYPVLVTKRRGASGDWCGPLRLDTWGNPISEHVPKLPWDELAPLHPALAAAAALAVRGNYEFSSPDYRAVCQALGLDPDPAPKSAIR